jgi:tetratricopeptide (TPR) repeat protein
MRSSIARVLAAGLVLAAALPATAARKPPLGLTLEQRQARERLRDGDRLMKEEAFLEAIAAYEEAERLDPLLMLAPYGIGRARMSLRDYPAAVDAYLRAETAFVNLQQAGADIRRTMGEARDDRMRIVSDAMREIEGQLSSVNPTSRLARRLNERLRALDVEYDSLEQQKAQASVGGGARMPPSLSLALGSAYFRAGRLADAEREYKTALAADPRLGEARNNLAVVYFETGRASEALREIELAEKAGFHVHPQLKQAVSRTLN